MPPFLRLFFVLGSTACLLLSGCRISDPSTNNPTNFTLLDPEKTGFRFTNTVTDTRDMNILNYHNFYNGGGVAIGDLNNDGKPDVVVTANQSNPKIFYNSGGMQFREAGKESGFVSSHFWHTGVCLVDINGDGWLDIYLCNAGMVAGDNRANELFINQQNGTFLEAAHEYGLDDQGATTQAVFFRLRP